MSIDILSEKQIEEIESWIVYPKDQEKRDSVRKLIAQARRAASSSLPGGEREALGDERRTVSAYLRSEPCGRLVADAWNAIEAALSTSPPPAAEPKGDNYGQVYTYDAEGRAATVDGKPCYTAPQPGGAEAKPKSPAENLDVLSGPYRRIDADEAQRLRSEGRGNLIEFAEGAGYIIYDEQARADFARNA